MSPHPALLKFFEHLGASTDASQEDLKRRRDVRRLEFHPDRVAHLTPAQRAEFARRFFQERLGEDPPALTADQVEHFARRFAEERFKEMAFAYAVLTDAKTQEEYLRTVAAQAGARGTVSMRASASELDFGSVASHERRVQSVTFWNEGGPPTTDPELLASHAPWLTLSAFAGSPANVFPIIVEVAVDGAQVPRDHAPATFALTVDGQRCEVIVRCTRGVADGTVHDAPEDFLDASPSDARPWHSPPSYAPPSHTTPSGADRSAAPLVKDVTRMGWMGWLTAFVAFVSLFSLMMNFALTPGNPWFTQIGGDGALTLIALLLLLPLAVFVGWAVAQRFRIPAVLNGLLGVAFVAFILLWTRSPRVPSQAALAREFTQTGALSPRKMALDQTIAHLVLGEWVMDPGSGHIAFDASGTWRLVQGGASVVTGQWRVRNGLLLTHALSTNHFARFAFRRIGDGWLYVETDGSHGEWRRVSPTARP